MLSLDASVTYQLVPVSTLPAMVRELADRGGPVGLDTETTDLDPWTSKLITVQLGDGQRVYVVDLRRVDLGDRAHLAEAVRLLFGGRSELLGHNLLFDCLHLAVALGIGPRELRSLRTWDTLLAEQVLLGGIETASGARERADLETTAARYGVTLTKEPRSWFAGLDKRPSWYEALPPEQLAYAAKDVAALPAIAACQRGSIALQGLEQTVELEMRCLPTVIAMELVGIRVDVPGWRAYIEGRQREAQQVERRIQAQLWPGYRAELEAAQIEATAHLRTWEADRNAVIATARSFWERQPKSLQPSWGETRVQVIARFRAERPRPETPKPLPDGLNLGSPVQLKAALQLHGVHLIDTAADTLEGHQREHLVLADLVIWRKRQKLVSAFGEAVLRKVRSDGRLHPSWRQIGSEASGVATGRMSCSEPNLQQLPAHDEAGGDSIRRHIVAPPGHILLACDYSQIEPRVLAELSGDRALLALFASGEDFYTGIAGAMGLCPAGTTKQTAKEMRVGDRSVRDIAKTLSLAVMYGKGPGTLSDDLGCSLDEARRHLDTFFATFPGVAGYQRQQQAWALAAGHTTTKGGRRRRFYLAPELQLHQFLSWDGFLAARQEWRIAESRTKRRAVNHTIQGTAADILKLALVLVFQRLPEGAQLVAAVHDELLVEARQGAAIKAAHVLATAMEQAARAYLSTVALGDFPVMRASYWRKER
jgi:DNA polymerase-1